MYKNLLSIQKFFFLVFLIFVVGGCEVLEPLPDFMKGEYKKSYLQIIGKWDWKETDIFLHGYSDYHTPESENESRRYVFKRNGTVERFINGERVSVQEYRLEYNVDIPYNTDPSFRMMLTPYSGRC